MGIGGSHQRVALCKRIRKQHCVLFGSCAHLLFYSCPAPAPSLPCPQLKKEPHEEFKKLVYIKNTKFTSFGESIKAGASRVSRGRGPWAAGGAPATGEA